MARTATLRYENARRLISDLRLNNDDPARSYDLAYEYDQGGNRTKKIDTRSSSYRVEVVYHYDIENPALYGSDNNRLMKYETYEITIGVTQSSTSSVTTTSTSAGTTTNASGGTTTNASGTTTTPLGGTMNAGFPGCGETTTLLSTTYYYYNHEGNVTRVVTEKAMPIGEPQYQATRLAYARNGRALTYALGETWDYNGTSITNHTITYAREFRYDSARQRYLNRELNPVILGDTHDLVSLGDTWSDYDGNEGYGDFTVTGGIPTEIRAFEPSIGTFGWTDDPAGNLPDAPSVEYYHPDMIGTLRTTSDAAGAGTALRVLTAFGDGISGAIDRYGYAGAWGYQTHEDFPYMHVGARYYDPSTGRFLQRDPIGILGGLNVYAYVANLPTAFADPSGYDVRGVITSVIAAIVDAMRGDSVGAVARGP